MTCPGCGREPEAMILDDLTVEEVFGEKLVLMRAESEEKAERARRIARIFRFICPSHYLPGDQEWGAF